MGIQTMSSQGGGGGGQQSQIQNLARQGSLYSLTLNEVQNHLGEPLNSMNLDELLKTVFPGEVNQPIGMDTDGATSQYVPGSGLQRQGSITMPRALRKKTVDEVWRDIQEGQPKGDEDQRPERQPTLGEMTLEDFLVKAGVVAEGSAKKRSDGIGCVGPIRNADLMAGLQDFSQGTAQHWLQYPQHQNMMGGYMAARSVPQSMGVGTGSMLEAMYSDGQMSISSPTVGALSDSHTPGRKRGASAELADKLLERRQKRMIKRVGGVEAEGRHGARRDRERGGRKGGAQVRTEVDGEGLAHVKAREGKQEEGGGKRQPGKPWPRVDEVDGDVGSEEEARGGRNIPDVKGSKSEGGRKRRPRSTFLLCWQPSLSPPPPRFSPRTVRVGGVEAEGRRGARRDGERGGRKGGAQVRTEVDGEDTEAWMKLSLSAFSRKSHGVKREHLMFSCNLAPHNRAVWLKKLKNHLCLFSSLSSRERSVS